MESDFHFCSLASRFSVQIVIKFGFIDDIYVSDMLWHDLSSCRNIKISFHFAILIAVLFSNFCYSLRFPLCYSAPYDVCYYNTDVASEKRFRYGPKLVRGCHDELFFEPFWLLKKSRNTARPFTRIDNNTMNVLDQLQISLKESIPFLERI